MIREKSGTLRGQGELVGDVLMGVATGGAVKAASKTAAVAKIASNLKRLAGAAEAAAEGADAAGRAESQLAEALASCGGISETAKPGLIEEASAEAKARLAAQLAEKGGVAADSAGARFGVALSTDYRATFLAAHPELEGKVLVHHAVEQQVLKKFPGVATEAEIHSLENLRGIPKAINSDVHLSQLRVEWNRFYKPFIESGTSPTKSQLLQKATEIDARFGSHFTPPVGGGQ
jgi:hypothetical protein